jgi:polysaccharide biosynthesis/export protein
MKGDWSWLRRVVLAAACISIASDLPLLAATQSGALSGGQATATPSTAGAAVVPTDYVIGAEDVLTIFFWREKDLTGDVVVRPDGRISLPLVNDIQAAGLTPEQLRANVTQAVSKYLEQPSVTVVVKTINSRRVFITGLVAKPAPYPLIGPTTVMQLIATAGGLMEYADGSNIRIVRTDNGKQVNIRFNYKDVTKGKNLEQNIELKPGDTVIVP